MEEINESHVEMKSDRQTLKNGTLYPVPEDLKNLIIRNNPECGIRFTLSQRFNDQMIIDGFILKKKRGPTLAKTGFRNNTQNERLVNWKCSKSGCLYFLVTFEGRIKSIRGVHDHARMEEEYVKKEARLRLKMDMDEGMGTSGAVHQVQLQNYSFILCSFSCICFCSSSLNL